MLTDLEIKTNCTVGLECHDSLTFVITKIPDATEPHSEHPPFPIAVRVMPGTATFDWHEVFPDCRCQQFYKVVPESKRQAGVPGTTLCACYGHLVE